MTGRKGDVVGLAPIFPYFGGKRRAAADVWDALGTVDRYIEPFFGSGAVLLGAPVQPKSELVNDISHHVANLWRSLQVDPEFVWRVATAPCSEVELKARTKFLRQWVAPDFAELAACDPFAAGVWLWVSCVAIGGKNHDLHRASHGAGVKGLEFTRDWFDAVCLRMSRVQVLCGGWERCVTPVSFLTNSNHVGIYLDPPYGEGNGVSYENQTGVVASDVWEWAIANGDNPKLRIIVSGYDDGRQLPYGWTAIERAEKGEFGLVNKDNVNRHRERLWCSPYCHRAQTIPLFSD